MYLSIDEGEITKRGGFTGNAVPWHWRHAACGSKKEAESRSVGRIVLEVRCSNDSAIRLAGERNGL